jgi:ApaG protein
MSDYQFDISVDTRFVAGESDPGAQRYVFAYTITIENKGDRPAQLMERRWLITNGEGQKQEVQGPGVVGKQPRILPGESFIYTSGAVLETAVGTMQGHYEFQTDDGALFCVPIAVFSFAVPNAVH